MGRLLGALLGGSRGDEERGLGEPPFAAKDWLLSKAERSFLGVLDRAIEKLPGGPYRVMCKVRLLDVVYFRKGATQAQTWRNKVDRRHLDFLIVTNDTLRPVAAVELDDRSHDSAKAVERDATKTDVLRAAGLPLVRVPARQSYRVEEIAARLADEFGCHS